jgi:hypothetical protein
MLASGNPVLDAQGNPIARPTLDQVMAETPSGAQWMTFSGAELDFLQRYLGNPIQLGTMAPQDPAGARHGADGTRHGLERRRRQPLPIATQSRADVQILVSTDATGATTVGEAIGTRAGRRFQRQPQHRLCRPRDPASGNAGKIRGWSYHRKLHPSGVPSVAGWVNGQV